MNPSDTGQEWPFVFGKVPYRPVDEQEWRREILRKLARNKNYSGD